MSDANPRFELVPLDPELAGPFAFDGEKSLRIGRDPESEIVLPYPSVSRRHAQIRFEDDRCLLLDVGSRHGTYLNGQQIETGIRSRSVTAIALRSRRMTTGCSSPGDRTSRRRDRRA